jgi:hypothetical protein
MGDDEEPQNRTITTHDGFITTHDGFRPGARYAFKDDPLPPSATLELPTRFRTSVDYRNDEIESALKTLEQLEKRFREDDPVRELLTIARRTAAKHFVVPPTGGDGLRVIK